MVMAQLVIVVSGAMIKCLRVVVQQEVLLGCSLE